MSLINSLSGIASGLLKGTDSASLQQLRNSLGGIWDAIMKAIMDPPRAQGDSAPACPGGC